MVILCSSFCADFDEEDAIELVISIVLWNNIYFSQKMIINYNKYPLDHTCRFFFAPDEHVHTIIDVSQIVI